MQVEQEILQAIPHREPFLWVDRITGRTGKAIHTEKTFPDDLDLYRGHYPGNPLTPGVILCEALFQTGALLISHLGASGDLDIEGRAPVVTRIESARFKRMVLPGETLNMKVELREVISQVYFMKGVGKVAGKTAIQVVFACTMAPLPVGDRS